MNVEGHTIYVIFNFNHNEKLWSAQPISKDSEAFAKLCLLIIETTSWHPSQIYKLHGSFQIYVKFVIS